MFDVSIVIVNWNTKDFLRECLDSIYAQTKDMEIEVFVVDNDSSDGSPEMVKIQYPQVRLIINNENLGFARANNQAIPEAKGRYVLLLNSDTVVLKDAIYEMVKFMDGHPNVGIVGAKLLNPDGTPQISHHSLPSLRAFLLEPIFLVGMLSIGGRDLFHRFNYSKAREVGYVSGACLMIRRQVIDEIGLLDERFFMYSEEADWCLRAKRSGWKICFIPQAHVIHYSRQSIKRYGLEEMSEEKSKSNYLFFKKHYGGLKANLFSFLVYFSIGLRVLFWMIIAPFAVRDRGEMSTRIRIYRSILRGINEGRLS